MLSRPRLLLGGALLLLLAAVWTEPAGSWLGEPDEARYAEIPREMLASGDFVTPRLNGVPYFEKPPLFYWCNAGALAAFGQTPWAARLTARLAGLGTAAVLVAGVGAASSLELGLAAAVLYLASPLGFVMSRLNITDGLLTFFFAATLFAAREALRRREAGRPAALWSALAGLAGGLGFLTKGLIAIVLPGGILLLWCLATRRARLLAALLLAPAPLVFLAVAAPWFVLVERRNPGFLQFFFIHEHFQRFATHQAHRPGPIYYFAEIFLAGFLPGLSFFFAGLSGKRPARWLSEDAEAFFLALWFSVVFLFFSVSSSKLPPYLLPAFPAAAALAAQGASRSGSRPGVWRLAALLATVLPAAVLVTPGLRRAVAELALTQIAVAGFAILLAGAWASPWAARRGFAAGLAALAAGWFGFCAGAALAWPRVPQAAELHNIEIVAAGEARGSGALVVGYRSYAQGLPWELKHPIPVADYVGELEPEFERRPGVRESLFWSRARFWEEWRSGRRILALVSPRDIAEFGGNRVVLKGRKYSLVANYD
ncbi:MAG TPA: phospholipid carrier-dependent glycosyltransferase [Thermoanaerobaculia bacterium]|nr:phospholipid carrier-dependent glycosyltransferase [Thermoanaerobaculia bacterium]